MMKKLLTIIATSLMVTAVNANPLTEFPKNAQNAQYLASCSAYINQLLIIDRKLGTGVVSPKTTNTALTKVFAFGYASIALSNEQVYSRNYTKALSEMKSTEHKYLNAGVSNIKEYTDYLSQHVNECVPKSTKTVEAMQVELTSFMQTMKRPENQPLMKGIQATLAKTNQDHINAN
ncbi:hypothetical protein [Acinetobacter baumannii]|uniref:hypothetical protein n=2 Tax=Acinetobacter baumannii TaxID=470 RepID=UPI0008DD1DC8|nr:hypothetical protein [Acinetobacter baumannii]OIB59882.1 hypothetical protein A7L04_06940 [Acinetobacter baumannii]OIB81454.1 hypothetical protein A7L08_07145 [Acinetobacter baumannii]OIF40833.1 hypothetical protein A7M41_12365 [Acinetobacter baumannii]HCJ6473267.1 hypothetical protein [Acinetobacter baumannii]HCJ7501921.1 hypothetical protein [Acinetobacter baumannii]